MSKLKVGIIGLPNVGKSTLFSALTRKSVPAENYPFCTIEPNIGIVEVPDQRVHQLALVTKSNKELYATCEFVDIAGLVEGASKGEGLGNQFLAHIRQVDLLLHNVRCFEDENIIHVASKIDPIKDVHVIENELILSDLGVAEANFVKTEKLARTQKDKAAVVALLQKTISHLESGQPLRSMTVTDEEKELLSIYNFLTTKSVLYAANMNEDDYIKGTNTHFEALKAYAKSVHAEVFPICAKLEAELAALPSEEAADFLASVGIKEPGLNGLIRLSFHHLGLICFFTTGPEETRAWTIRIGTKAPAAASEIHSDIERGFIRAEVVAFKDYIEAGGRPEARSAGKARMEGKEYVVQDGDVILFFHNT